MLSTSMVHETSCSLNAVRNRENMFENFMLRPRYRKSQKSDILFNYMLVLYNCKIPNIYTV